MDLEQERLDMLAAAEEQRARQVMQYQVDIDNFTRAMAEIEAQEQPEPGMGEFFIRLRELLASTRIEQAKERIMLKVVKDQLEEVKCM